MARPDRNIILLVRDPNLLQHDIEMKVKGLYEVIASVETSDCFCRTFELVQRNHITQKKYKILEAIREGALKPFHFLISKN